MKDEPDSSSKPNQPPAASLPIFDGVKGIDDARDVQVREKTALDKLLELSEVFTASLYPSYNSGVIAPAILGSYILT